jgi:GH35 family endo-1,4-beta-xylanase
MNKLKTLFSLTAMMSAVSIPALADINSRIDVNNDWGIGYCAALQLTNTGANAETWSVSLDVGGSVSNLWNATWSQSGNVLTVSGLAWNAVLQPGQVDSSVGFCVDRNGDTGGGDNGGDTGGDNGDYEVPANNFAVNGGTESGLQNWSTVAGSLMLTTNDSHSGSSSVLISGRTANWHGITFNVGALTNGNDYDVATWVKLAPGEEDATLVLTAKRQDDGDSSTYNEFEQVASATASADQWTLLQGFYTQGGTPFEHFIIESEDDFVSFYADDFSIGGEVSDDGGDNGTGNYKYVGNITTRGAVRSDFVQYWDQITPENEGKWGSIERQRDVYNWGGVDAAYNYAKQNNIPFKQHTFVWGSQYPTWIDSLSPSEQAAEIEEWIRDFCTRYPDVDQIDVVNEATPGHAPANYAQRAFGNDWIIKSFQLARQYCPNAELILNDYNVLIWNTNEFISMATPAINAGVVDAIGLQAHGLADLSFSELEGNLNRIAALGLPIYISEYDIEKTNDQAQLNVMKSQFPLFYNHPSVKGITLWGYVVGATWRDGTGLIQSNGTPRPAMTWLMDYLEEQRGSVTGGGDNGGDNQVCDLKSNYNWTSSGPLITPHNSSWASIKDPTVVKYNNKYHVFATVFDAAKDNWGGVYLNFKDFNQAGTATQVDMSTTRAGNTVAPEVFYFEPHQKWYMIYQWGAKYSTNTDISNPAGWTTPQPLLSNGLSNGIDYWVICDDNYCHLFFSGDDGKLYRSKVSIGNFPNFSGYEVVMQDSVARLFEASNVYKVEGTNKYLLLVEAYGPRYFRSWTSTSLDGPWTPLADTQSNPFAGAANVSFPSGKWTNDISHGEMIRSGYDQTLTINACNMQYLYQGVDPNSGVSDYNRLPYKIGLISAQ